MSTYREISILYAFLCSIYIFMGKICHLHMLRWLLYFNACTYHVFLKHGLPQKGNPKSSRQRIKKT